MNESKPQNMTINDLSYKFDRLEGKVDDLVEVVDRLAIMMFNGFEKIEKRFQSIDVQFYLIEENFVTVRRDIMNSGDRFPSNYAFDELSHRVSVLEDSKKEKE